MRLTKFVLVLALSFLLGASPAFATTPFPNGDINFIKKELILDYSQSLFDHPVVTGFPTDGYAEIWIDDEYQRVETPEAANSLLMEPRTTNASARLRVPHVEVDMSADVLVRHGMTVAKAAANSARLEIVGNVLPGSKKHNVTIEVQKRFALFWLTTKSMHVETDSTGMLRATVEGDYRTAHRLKISTIEDERNVSLAVYPDISIADEPAPPVISVAGSDRFETAVKASKQAFPDGLPADGARTVIIATGMNWPDALGGASLAGALGGSILLVDGNGISDNALAEIARLDARNVIILGGTAAVSPGVEQTLKDRLGRNNVERVAGANRYATANEVAERVISLQGGGFEGTAFVATGENFPDALAAAPLAAAKGWPLFLVNPNTGLSAETTKAMAGVKEVVMLGGANVVPTSVQRSIEASSVKVTRLAGFDRYHTAVMVAGYGVTHAGMQWNMVGIATGTNFPDALAGGIVQGRANSVMLLTPSTKLDSYVEAALSANKASIRTVTYFGGLNAVNASVRSAVTNALK